MQQAHDSQLDGYRRDQERLAHELSELNKKMTDHDIDSMKQLAELSKKYDERIEHLNREKESEYRKLQDRLRSEKVSIKSSIDSAERQLDVALSRIKSREQQLKNQH